LRSGIRPAVELLTGIIAVELVPYLRTSFGKVLSCFFKHLDDMNIQRFRPSLKVETPSLVASGHFLLANVLFAKAALTCAFEVIAKIF
jgi:hypothetical protein